MKAHISELLENLVSFRRVIFGFQFNVDIQKPRALAQQGVGFGLVIG
jgi:hypothetical protein